ARAPRSQEAVRRRRQRAGRQDIDGEEGERVVREVPIARGTVGPHRRGRLPSVGLGVSEDVRGRRTFLAKTAALGASAMVASAPDVIAQPKIQWRMSTAWTKTFDVFQGAAQRLGKIVEETSGGRFRIEVVQGGQIMPPFACFDATSKGTIEAFMGSPQYWQD